MVVFWPICGLLLAGFGSCQSDDGLSNLRPTNITSLAYYLYKWTGSYYNGTTSIRIEPEDYDDETDCDTFTNGQDVEITYENSLLSIIEPNRYYEDHHDFEFALTYWDKSVNITPTSLTWGNSPVNDVRTIKSVSELDSYTHHGTPYWKYDSLHVSGTSFSFSGYHNSSEDDVTIAFNYSSCSSTSPMLWGGAFLGPEADIDGLDTPSNPRISGRFDNRSASIEITGTYRGWAAFSEGEEGDDSTLAGSITISFLGQIDGNRSDELQPGFNDTPLWNRTLGYSKMLFDESRGYKGVAVVSTLAYSLACFGVLACVL